MYVSDKKEIFQYGTAEIPGNPVERMELPFLESLLSFQELDFSKLTPIFRQISTNWKRFIHQEDQAAGTEAMMALKALSSIHIYFKLLYIRWYDRFYRIECYHDSDSTEDREMEELLNGLPEQLLLYQKQVQRFFDLVLECRPRRAGPPGAGGKELHLRSPERSRFVSVSSCPAQLRAGGTGAMFAGVVFLQSSRYDRLLPAELRGAEDHRAALQELWSVLCTDWASQRGVL